MKKIDSEKTNGEGVSTDIRLLTIKAAEAQRHADEARDRARAAKAKFKQVRKAFKSAKKLSKRAKKEAKIAAKALIQAKAAQTVKAAKATRAKKATKALKSKASATGAIPQNRLVPSSTKHVAGTNLVVPPLRTGTTPAPTATPDVVPKAS